jgi:hypothetical protein
MSGRVVGEGGRVVVEVIALAVEIAEKSQIAVQARKEVVNAGTSSCLIFFRSWFYTAVV